MRVLSFMALVLILTNTAMAGSDYKTGGIYRIAENDTLENDLFYGGRNLYIDGVIRGDLNVVSQSAELSGVVEDDILAWNEITLINGTVNDGVTALSKEVYVSGKIKGDLRAGGQIVIIEDGAEIFGDLYTGCQSLIIKNATIHGEIYGGCNDAFINGNVKGPIELGVDKIEFGENFRSGDKLIIHIDEFKKDQVINAPEYSEINYLDHEFFFGKFTFYWFLLSALVIGFILMAISKNFYMDIAALGRKRTLQNTGVGLLFLLGLPIIILFSILVLPLALILSAIYLILLYLSKIFTAFILGRMIQERILKGNAFNSYLGFALGLIALSLIFQIPVLGGLLQFLSLLLGSGVFIYYLWNVRKAQT